VNKVALFICVSVPVLCCPCSTPIAAGAATATVSADAGGGKIRCIRCQKPFQAGLIRCPHCQAKTQISCLNPACRKKIYYGTIQCPHCEKLVPYSRLRFRVKTDKSATQPAKKEEPEKPAPPKKKLTAEEKKKLQFRVDRLVNHLTGLYCQPLLGQKQSRDWLKRSFAVAALGRLDAPQTTEKLLEVLKSDRDPLVKLYAWEALLARSKGLSPEDHKKWVDLGMQAYMTTAGKCFVGDFKSGLMRAAAGYGPTAKFRITPQNLLMKLFKEAKHTNPADYETLTAIRETVAAWHDPMIIKAIVAQSRPDTFNKVEYVLGGLDASYTPVSSLNKRCGGKEIIAAKKIWYDWLKARPDLKAAGASELKQYTGKSNYFPEPGKIPYPTEENKELWQK